MIAKRLIEEHISNNYRKPSGFFGRIAGNRMVQQHEPENNWTVTLLSVQPKDSILEIGFGAGATIQRIADLATEGYVAGVDFSRTMVHAARRRNASAVKAGRVELQYGDAAILPFADSMFDKVLSIHSLYFWPDPTIVFAEILRVLKPEGIVILTLLPKERWPGDGEGTEECRVYRGEDIKNMLTQVGFVSTRIEPGNIELFRELAVIGTK